MKSSTIALSFVITLSLTGCASTEEKVTSFSEAAKAVVERILSKAKREKSKSKEIWGHEVGEVVDSETMAYMNKQAKALEQVLAGTRVTVEREGANVNLILPGHVTFARNSSQISQSFAPTLQKIAKVINANKKTIVMVEGHTDGDGTEKYNLGLSERRAESVKKMLQQYKVNSSRMTTLGMGEYMPIADNDTASGKQKNRRVELSIQPITS